MKEESQVLESRPGADVDVNQNRVDVCICSYKRPEIVETMAAVARQIGIEDTGLRVLIADNTDAGAMREAVFRTAQALQLDVVYIHAPANNISIARNACLSAANADWIAFLDDDETPAPGWLSALLAEAARSKCDVVLGPVKALYQPDAPDWARDGDFCSTAPVWVGGQIRTAYTGNVLFRRALAESLDVRFRVELGKTGGEDEDFFYRLFDAGARIGFAPSALAFERIDSRRTRISFLLRRSFRAGQSHGSSLARGKIDLSWEILRASAKAATCSAGAVLWMWHAVRRNRFLMRAALHVGVVARLAGYSEIENY